MRLAHLAEAAQYGRQPGRDGNERREDLGEERRDGGRGVLVRHLEHSAALQRAEDRDEARVVVEADRLRRRRCQRPEERRDGCRKLASGENFEQRSERREGRLVGSASSVSRGRTSCRQNLAARLDLGALGSGIVHGKEKCARRGQRKKSKVAAHAGVGDGAILQRGADEVEVPVLRPNARRVENERHRARERALFAVLENKATLPRAKVVQRVDEVRAREADALLAQCRRKPLGVNNDAGVDLVHRRPAAAADLPR